MKKSIPERIKNWALAIVLAAVAAMAVLIVITVTASFYRDVSHTTETIRELVPSLSKIVGIQ